jgi:hypothetical protein
MPGRDKRRPDETKTTKDKLRGALDRLKAGRPTHPDLIKAAKLGRLRPWSPTVLALESGVSKKSFDREKSNHPWAWQEQQEIKALLTEGKATDTPRSTTDANRALRERNNELKQKVKLLLAQNTALVRRLQSVDADMARKLREQERLAARGNRNLNQMPAKAASTKASDTVVQLHQEQKE